VDLAQQITHKNGTPMFGNCKKVDLKLNKIL